MTETGLSDAHTLSFSMALACTAPRFVATRLPAALLASRAACKQQGTRYFTSDS